MHDRCSDIIRDIVERIDNGEFRSETDVRRGIVDPLLEKLRWPLRRPRVVEREYPVEGGRVDYALCDQKEPLVFIEAKRPEGISDASRQQLFRYCAAHGVPMAVLTDGGTWNFFLPLRKGTLDERSLHPIALSADPTEACRVLHRYLQHVAVTSEKNIDAATRDLEHMRFERACESVWRRVVERPADDFVAMFAEEIRSEAVIDPPPDAVAHWLRARAAGKPRPPEPAPPKPPPPPPISPGESHYTIFRGEKTNHRTATAVLVQAFTLLAEEDPDFLRQYGDKYRGPIKRRVARTRDEIHGDNRRVRAQCRKLPGGWWIDTCLNNDTKVRYIKDACRLAGVEFGRELIIGIPPPAQRRA